MKKIRVYCSVVRGDSLTLVGRAGTAVGVWVDTIVGGDGLRGICLDAEGVRKVRKALRKALKESEAAYGQGV